MDLARQYHMTHLTPTLIMTALNFFSNSANILGLTSQLASSCPSLLCLRHQSFKAKLVPHGAVASDRIWSPAIPKVNCRLLKTFTLLKISRIIKGRKFRLVPRGLHVFFVKVIPYKNTYQSLTTRTHNQWIERFMVKCVYFTTLLAVHLGLNTDGCFFPGDTDGPLWWLDHLGECLLQYKQYYIYGWQIDAH